MGTYVYDQPGAVKGFHIEVVVPAPPDNPTIQEIEAYRATVNAPAPIYVLAQLDNTASSGMDLKVNAITVVTDPGDQLEMVPVWQWRGLDLKSNAGVELYNKLLKGGYALPGARSSQVFVLDAPLPSVKSVFAGGFVGQTSLKQRMRKT